IRDGFDGAGYIFRNEIGQGNGYQQHKEIDPRKPDEKLLEFRIVGGIILKVGNVQYTDRFKFVVGNISIRGLITITGSGFALNESVGRARCQMVENLGT